VATSKDDERRSPGGRGDCAECGSACVEGQRYCLTCGARRGPLPAAVVAIAAGVATAGAAAGAASAAAKKAIPRRTQMPSPRAALVAVMCMLAFGVVLGSATSQLAQSAGLTSILLEVAPTPPEPEPAEVAGVEPEEEEFEPEETALAQESAAPASPAEPVAEEELPAEEEAPIEEPVEPPPPTEIKHVFVVMLGETSYEETFGATSTAPYLSKELPAQGELLPNYYSVAKGDLANQLALISGQGPTPETTINCPTYADVVPATVLPEGQVQGNGCVYPATVPSLPAALAAKKLTWKAYVEDIGNGIASGQPATCRHPALGSPDTSPVPVPGDNYVTWRNPFVYLHSVIDSPECAKADAGLDQLLPDLKKKVTKQTPSLFYIVPNACHSGAEAPCEPGRLAGAAGTEELLKTLVPEILKSPAYADHGMLVITSSQSRQASAAPGFVPDASSCCFHPAFPNLPPEAPPAATGAGAVQATGGGGKVGMLLISQLVEAGTVEEGGYYNHYSLLKTIEELLGLELTGYAADPTLFGFEERVLNPVAVSAEEEALPTGLRPFRLSRAGSAAR
jgi:hypothetical protein